MLNCGIEEMVVLGGGEGREAVVGILYERRINKKKKKKTGQRQLNQIGKA